MAADDGGTAAAPSDAPPAEADDGDVRGGELMPFDDGSMSSDKAQSSAMSLVINYAEPHFAAGTAVFGLGLLVMPLIARMNSLSTENSFEDPNGMFAYERHGETNPKQPMRLFSEAEMRQRLGMLDAAFLMREITMSTDGLDEFMNEASIDEVEDTASKIQKWRDKVNTNMKSLQKRSALAFLGLPPESSDADVNKMYKKMALELHPDKGGDPEKFQELQEMKERLTELEKDDEKKDDEDPDDEEAKKAKEEEKKKEEEEESKKLPPDERVKKLRMEVHDNTVRIWQRAKKAQEEIVGEKTLKANAQPALNILRQFVDRFVNNEVKTLRHDDKKGADAKFRKFLKQGAEIISVAAMHDVQSTLSTVAMHFNYRIVARSGSPEMKEKCASLLEAISEVPAKAEAFIKELEDSLSDQKERDKRRKEEKAAEQKKREARGDLSGEAGEAKSAEANAKAKAAPSKAGDAADPFADFDFDEKPKAEAPKPKAKPKAAESTALSKKDEEKSAIAAAMNQTKRTGWDPNFDHPYAGALKSNGTGIYCRPCQRWIVTYEYNTEVFNTHVERAHPKPPPGWQG